jgi:hypothetical protein
MKSDALVGELNRAEFTRQPLNSATAFSLALHTQQPDGEAQTRHEIALPGYARATVNRDADHWQIGPRHVSNARRIEFPTITGGKATATWLSIGIDGQIRRTMKLDEPIKLAANRRIEFAAGQIHIEESA